MSDQSAHETTQPATENDQDDVSRDTESPRGEWGGPREEAGTPSTADDGDSMTIVEPEDFAATEPLMAADQSPPVEPTPVTEPDVREQYAAATSDGSASQGDLGHGSSGSEGHDPDSEVGNADNAVVIGDTDAYASTEPLLAGDSTPGAQHDAGADSSVDEGVGANDTDRGEVRRR